MNLSKPVGVYRPASVVFPYLGAVASTESSPITDVTVERIHDSFLVTWQGAPDASVFLSDNPDDAGVNVRAPDAPGIVAMSLPDPTQRYYVHLFADGGPFVVAGERRVALEGPHNVRDLGGYATPDGPTQWGRVFRADDPSLLTSADVAYLERLGITHSFDFRGDGEVDEAPSTLSTEGSIAYERLAIGTSGPNNQSVIEMLKAGELRQFTFDDMADGYGRMLHNHGDKFASVIRQVADPASGATIFNCTGGRDRTGLTAALLLLMVGVDERDVLDDYVLSSEYLPAEGVEERFQKLAALGIERDDLRGMFELRRETLDTTLGKLRKRHGSIEGYLRGKLGLDDDVFAGVRARLIEPR